MTQSDDVVVGMKEFQSNMKKYIELAIGGKKIVIARKVGNQTNFYAEEKLVRLVPYEEKE